MFTSRPSDPRTVLLWGDRWWVAPTGDIGRFANLAEAVVALAGHFRDEPKPVRLRLVYAPDSFASVVTPCPPGNRATLAAALAADFPAIGRDGVAWSHDPVLTKDGVHSTVLHCEGEPGLFGLASELARLGLAIESVWPVAAYLPGLLHEWTDSGAFTILLADHDRACAHRHGESGERTVEQWHGDKTIAEVEHWLGTLLSADPGEPVLIVSADESATEILRSFLGEEHARLEFVSLREVLGRPNLLPRYHPAQLLPKPPTFTAQRMVIAAGILCLLTAGWRGAEFFRDHQQSETGRKLRQSQSAALQTEIVHLKENRAAIADLRRLMEDGVAGPPCDELLAQLARTVPAEAVISSARINGRSFEFAGWIAPNAPAGTIERWLRALAGGDAHWTAEFRTGATGAFTISGGFRP